jgi:hypothetical protein
MNGHRHNGRRRHHIPLCGDRSGTPISPKGAAQCALTRLAV